MPCLVCAAPVHLSWKFCGQCGTPLNLKACGHCGSINNRDSMHCARCAAAFEPERPAQSGLANAAGETDEDYRALLQEVEREVIRLVETQETGADPLPTPPPRVRPLSAGHSREIIVPPRRRDVGRWVLVVLLAAFGLGVFRYARPPAAHPPKTVAPSQEAEGRASSRPNAAALPPAHSAVERP